MIKKVDFYLDELLLQHNCVVVPGFGGFITNYSDASYNSATGLFLPPAKQLIFNKNLTSNDGLLCRYIAEKEHITFNEATAKVENTVLAIDQSLHLGYHIELKNLGLLYIDTENAIQFKLTNTNNFLLESFGLPGFYMQQKQSNIASKLDSKFIDRPAIPSEKRKSSSVKKYWPAFVFIPLAIGIVIFQNQTNFLGKLNISSASWNPFSKHNDPDTVYISVKTKTKQFPATFGIIEKEQIAEVATPEATAVENNTPNEVAPVTVAPTKKEFRFYIVAGCFQSERNANKLVKKLQAKSFDASIIGKNENGLYRVAVSGFETKEQADAELLQVKNNIETAWILSL